MTETYGTYEVLGRPGCVDMSLFFDVRLCSFDDGPDVCLMLVDFLISKTFGQGT